MNKNNGEIIWVNKCDEKRTNCSFALSNRYLFHAETDGKIRCFDKMTGEQIWEYGYQLYTEHCQLIGDKLVTLQSDGTAIILNPETGKKIVKRKLVDGFLHTKPLFIGNKLYLGYGDDVAESTKGEMVCFSYDEDFNFVREFGYEVDSDITSNILVDDDKIMFATKNEKMYLIENQNGEKIEKTIKTKGACRYIFTHKDCILVISDKGQVECYQ